MTKLRYLGLDVHAETIAIAVAEPNGEVRSVGQIPNRPESVRRLVKKRGAPEQLRACYEAGPTGYVLYWQLTALGVPCEVVAPTLIPVKAGDRVKTDHYVHEVDHAAGRLERLERAIDAAVRTAPAPLGAVIAGLQALRGVAQVAAVTLACEVGPFARFRKATQLMGYAGVVAREASSGARTWRGGITKTGNAHLRRIVVEAAWAYRHRPAVGGALKARQVGVSDAVKEIAWKAQHRLHDRYRTLVGRGKAKPQAVTAVGRELLGFIWAIGVHVEQQARASQRWAA